MFVQFKFHSLFCLLVIFASDFNTTVEAHTQFHLLRSSLFPKLATYCRLLRYLVTVLNRLACVYKSPQNNKLYTIQAVNCFPGVLSCIKSDRRVLKKVQGAPYDYETSCNIFCNSCFLQNCDPFCKIWQKRSYEEKALLSHRL